MKKNKSQIRAVTALPIVTASPLLAVSLLSLHISLRAQAVGPNVQLAPAAGAVAIANKKAVSYSGFGAESLPPHLLKEFAPPAIEPESSQRIEKLLDLQGQGYGILNTRGSELFFDWRITGVQQVWKTQPGSFPVQLTSGEDRTSVVAVSPQDDFILVSRDRKGEELPGLYEMSSAGGALLQIQHLPKVQTFFQKLSPDGKKILFRSNHIEPKSYVISEYDRTTRTITEVFKQPGSWVLRDVSSDQNEWLLANLTGSLTREIFLFNRKTQALTPLLGQGEKEEYDISFGKKSGEYLVLTNRFGDSTHLYLWEPSAKNPWRDLTVDLAGEVSSFQISRDRKRIVLTTLQNALSRPATMLYGSFKLKTLKLDPEVLQFDGRRLAEKGDLQVGMVERADRPPELVVIDWENLKYKEWTKASTPEVERVPSVAPVAEIVTTRDGQTIPMFVWRPEHCATSVCPVVIEYHGGPEGMSAPGFNIDARLFNNEGFIYALPNVRGSSGYGKAFIRSDDGPERLKVITDIEDVALHFKKKLSGEKVFVAAIGGSYGGYSTLVAMTKFSQTFDVGVASVGMSNLITFLENTAPYRRHLRISEYGDPAVHRAELWDLSPIRWISQVKAPVLLFQGLNDPRVPAGEALQFYRALKSKNQKSKLVIFPDEGHGIAKRSNRAIEMSLTINFIVDAFKATQAKADAVSSTHSQARFRTVTRPSF